MRRAYGRPRVAAAMGICLAILAAAAGARDRGMDARPGAPPGQPVLALVPVTGNGDAETGALQGVNGGRAMIMRGLTVRPVKVTAGERLPVARDAVPMDAAAESAAHRRSRGFFAPYRDLLGDAPGASTDAATEGSFLVVTAPDFQDAIAPFVAWKRELGYAVRLATTDETGAGGDAIRAWIQALYDTAAVPPQYLVLAGDVDQIPAFNYNGDPSDLPYSLLDGDDFLPDILVGRLSAQTTAELETIVAKILRYEQDPWMGDGGAWLESALMIGGDAGSETPVATMRWCREQILSPEMGYTRVDSVWFPPFSSTGFIPIRTVINRGVSMIAYRGWARGTEGWESPLFTTTHIPALTNGWMLPVVMSFVCGTGNYQEPECMGESWIRAGSAASPKGGVAFIGNSEHWSHTRLNDAAAIGAFHGMRQNGLRRLGDILNASKGEILYQFPDELYFATSGDQSVEFYYYIYSLLGDPTMEIRMAPPRAVTVTAPDSLAPGQRLIEITVTDGAIPLAGARVGASRGTTTLGCTWTDDAGHAAFAVDAGAAGDTVRICVSGGDILPARLVIPVRSATRALGITAASVIDDGSGGTRGNGDGRANPGEVVALRIMLRNDGSAALASIAGTLESDAGEVGMVSGDTGLDALASGETAEATPRPLVVIDITAANGRVIPFRLVVAAAGGALPNAGFELPLAAPDFRYESHAIAGDGLLVRGRIDSIRVTLRNDGIATAGTTAAILSTSTPGLVTLVDNGASFEATAAGGAMTSSTPFAVQVADTAATGAVAVFSLDLTGPGGERTVTSFSAVIGAVDLHAPTGPDDYGYFAYDNSDTDYPDAAPLYDWVTCSSAYGGPGTLLAMGDSARAPVALPFSFRFYGQDYDTIRVYDGGFISFDTRWWRDYFNWHLPAAYGNGAMIAPFWDNLDPSKHYPAEDPLAPLVGDGIYAWSDTANHRFIVEWSRLGNERLQHPGRADWDDLQTFELILFDPAFVPTPGGDGLIRFQYKQVINNDSERMYATTGIEDAGHGSAIEYTYSNHYAAGASPLSPGLAIDITTRAPHYVPFTLARFETGPVAAGGAIALAWEPVDARPRGEWRIYRAAPGAAFEAVPGGTLPAMARSFVDVGADPGAVWQYRVGSFDPVGRETVLGPYDYRPGRAAGAGVISLALVGANPVPGAATLRFSTGGFAGARIDLFDVTGRHIRTLAAALSRGGGEIAWDGRDDNGRPAPSGVYVARLEGGGESRRLKLVLIR